MEEEDSKVRIGCHCFVSNLAELTWTFHQSIVSIATMIVLL